MRHAVAPVIACYTCMACAAGNNPGATNANPGAGNPNGTNAGSDLISCDDWHRAPIPGTGNVLVNNVWNKQHADSFPYKQCLIRRTTHRGAQYGWTWDWPECDTITSYAAPEVVFGRKPWDGGASTNGSLPKTIGAIHSLLVDFGVTISADPCYNLNTTMWLTQTAAAPKTRDPEQIVAEVMVRFSDPAHIHGCCEFDGYVTLGDLSFDVYHHDGHEDMSGGSNHTWKMVTYVSKTTRFATHFDLALVLRDMVSKGLAASTQGVQGVELITEVSGGKGQLWLNRFDVTVN